jgi:collagenase-like PrtC family protease
MRLALGAIPYYWERRAVFDFYRAAAGWPVDIVYLGEVVCAKRRELRRADWLAIARELAGSGKEAVLSTLALVEAESELAALRRLIDNGAFPIEANDMSAVNLAARRVPFVAGAHINTYNAAMLELLAAAGALRWVVPVELDRATLAALQAARPAGMQTEVHAFGRLPLSFSARCFTARAHNLPKDRCGWRCRDYPAGMLLSTREDRPFLVLNGVQTLSAPACNLVAALPEMARLGVDVARISPQPEGTGEVIEAFREALRPDGDRAGAAARLARWLPHGACNGHWYGRPGMEWVEG